MAAAEQLQASQRETQFATDGGRWARIPLANLLAEPLRTGVATHPDPAGTERLLSLAAARWERLDFRASRQVASPLRVIPYVRDRAFYIVRGNGRLDLVGRGALAVEPPARTQYSDLLIQAVLREDVMLPDFMPIAWHSAEVRRQVEGLSRTAAGIHKVNLRNLARVLVPTPPLEHQRRVALSDARLAHGAQQVRSGLLAQLDAVDRMSVAIQHREFSP